VVKKIVKGGILEERELETGKAKEDNSPEASPPAETHWEEEAQIGLISIATTGRDEARMELTILGGVEGKDRKTGETILGGRRGGELKEETRLNPRKKPIQGTEAQLGNRQKVEKKSAGKKNKRFRPPQTYLSRGRPGLQERIAPISGGKREQVPPREKRNGEEKKIALSGPAGGEEKPKRPANLNAQGRERRTLEETMKTYTNRGMKKRGNKKKKNCPGGKDQQGEITKESEGDSSAEELTVKGLSWSLRRQNRGVQSGGE